MTAGRATCPRSSGPPGSCGAPASPSVTARAGRIEHRFTVDGYVAFLTEFDEETLFAEMEPGLRERLLATLRARLGGLSGDDMTMRLPIVFASGRAGRRPR